MAIYEDTYNEAEETIKRNWNDSRSKPKLFAKVRIKFGDKYLLDYSESTFKPGISVLEDFSHKINLILKE